MSDLIERLPSGPVDKPVEQWSHTELLTDTARLGLMRVRELVSTPIVEDMDAKDKRLIAEMGLGAAKLLGNLQQAAFNAGQDNDKSYKDMLKIIREIQEKGKPKQ